MSPTAAQGTALILMLLALPLTSLGTTTGTQWLNVFGLILLGVGALTSPILRIISTGADAPQT